jgi:uracil-DNA glycosylase family 4
MIADVAATADAYMAWWSLAGVDCAIAETPVNWLRPVVSPSPAPGPAIAAPGRERPSTLEAFTTWAISDPTRPERNWPGAPILPAGGPDAPLMIIGDMPDQADMAAGALFSGKAGELLDAMLRAIGLTRAQTMIAPLFFARPPGGMVEAADLETAATRMRLLISLATPARVLLLGDRATKALAGATDGGDGLRPLNHDGGTVASIATFHPRLLLGQPAAKAECWRALSLLIEDEAR